LSFTKFPVLKESACRGCTDFTFYRGVPALLLELTLVGMRAEDKRESQPSRLSEDTTTGRPNLTMLSDLRRFTRVAIQNGELLAW
jgi:hypothetical protein